MSCEELCDGCNQKGTHHLCEDCVTERIDRLKKESDTYRDEAVRQMEYGIKQHEFAQDALRLRDAVRDAAERLQSTLWDREALLDEQGRKLEAARAEVERLRGVVRMVNVLAAGSVESGGFHGDAIRDILRITKVGP